MRVETLREFLEIVKLGGFNRAAKTLFVSQPNLSAHIAAMERELGFEAIDRSRPGAALTPAGAAFLSYAQTAVSAIEEGTARARAIACDLPPLRLAGVGPSSPALAAIDAIGSDEEPRFTLVDGNVENGFLTALLSEEADLEVCSVPFRPDELAALEPDRQRGTELRVARAGTGAGAIAMSSDNPLAEVASLTTADLDGKTVVINECRYFDK